MSFLHIMPRIDRTIAPNDDMYSAFQKNHTVSEYFNSGIRQLETIDAILQAYVHKSLGEYRSIADYACNYGRLLRCLRAANPDTMLYAYDIDQAALDFCAQHFKCIPVLTDWRPDKVDTYAKHDLIICVSLLTHTDNKKFLPKVLKLWEKILLPGGVLLFTYLGENYIGDWRNGKMAHYGPTEAALMEKRISSFYRKGHTFYGYATSYSREENYGIGFVKEELIKKLLRRHKSLHYLGTNPGNQNNFWQDLAIIRKNED